LRALYAPRGVTLVEVAGKWRFQTAQDLAYLFVEERQVQKKLGQAALETLAIVAYGQPVTRAEVEAVRGVAVSKTTIDTLLETGWIKMAGQRKTPGQPMQYKTTSQFLEHFGLESLDTLPGKADLEAEGLLTDAIPAGFQMPDEEALSEEGMLIDEAGDEPENDAFVTDFMDEDEAESEAVVEAVTEDTDDEVEALADVETENDVDDYAEERDHAFEDETDSVELASESASAEAVESEDDDEGVSVFSYTREAETAVDAEVDVEDAVVGEPEVEDDESAIEAAIIKLAKEPREPERPMWTWDDDD
ncbi:UNVERIFIED_CONTAM: hypothetical protein GTU68_019332, partial [Idotea baltica]|nr:hypothetical protein [Idotea baltica]